MSLDSKTLTLALDAMGGDNAPHSVVDGAALAVESLANVHFTFFGDEKKISPLLNAHPKLQKLSTVVHTDEYVQSDERPSVALRRGKKTSMRLAIDAVKCGEADAVVSAGNTGALMAMAKIVLRPLEGISRPAISGIMPNYRHDVVMLDLGANLECSPTDLCNFAVMGDAYARVVLDYDKPAVALLNIGSEDMKGREEIREAAAILREKKDINFIGFIEADGILRGEADVIVCDGFTGNIALKAIEGTSSFMGHNMKQAFASSFLSKIGYIFCRSALNELRKKIDPRRYNGAMFLGLNGIAVKSHGGTDAYGFLHAIEEAAELVESNINTQIIEELKLNGLLNKANDDTPVAPKQAEG